ncbi:hypothetical protein O7626_39680 [Micromonospora sp. WMMD1102]|uniref:hypothetical protein n=1 Tax=Micromonospora sp. WMMD1102 TaxID=3016105 RepID=UPI0024155B71|nr:hypothetical protein [Micromonospora sp. WMMD1102]MDG4791936.1 hypothetical protein [Micromonospora sp. WMMD1102]
MSLVTGEDRAIGVGFVLSVVAIFGLVVLCGYVIPREIYRYRQSHAELDPAQDALRWRWGTQLLSGVVARRSDAPVSHRAPWQLPAWLLTLVAHGQAKEPAGYGPPPPLAVVEQPTVTAWPTSDTNTVRWPSNPVRNPTPVQAASDPLDAALTVGRVLADPSLRNLVRQPTSMDATQQLEPIRAEVLK